MTTQINGVEITEKISEVLRRWYKAQRYDDSFPYYYVANLSQIQDYLCRKLGDYAEEPEVPELISYLIELKDDLKQLIPEKEAYEQNATDP